MNKKDGNVNGVNGTHATSEGVTPGRVTGGEQPAPGRYPATARAKWSKDLNKLVMKCYIKSNPGTRGYRKRMTAIWREIGEFEVSDQRLADQARTFKVNGWLSDIEIEELKREVDSRGVVCDEGSGSTHLTSELVRETDKETQSASVGNMHYEADVGASQQSMSSDTEGLTDEENEIYDRIMRVVNGEERDRLPALRKVNRKKLKAEVNKVNQVLKKMAPEGITNTNDLIYAGAVVVTEELGVRNKKGTKPKEPLWKRGLTTQVKEMRRDLSRVTALLQGRMLKEHHKRELERKYKIAEIGLKHVSEDLKQRITAMSTKIRKYENRNKQFHQNRLFETDQRKFYTELTGDKISSDMTPDSEEAKQFWESIWSIESTHNKDAEWLKKLKEEVELPQQVELSITIDMVTQFLRKVPNWKAPGPDMVQGFWLKNFTGLHHNIANQLQVCLDCGNVPGWMTKGRTVHIMKDPEKGTVAGNYRPIT